MCIGRSIQVVHWPSKHLSGILKFQQPTKFAKPFQANYYPMKLKKGCFSNNHFSYQLGQSLLVIVVGYPAPKNPGHPAGKIQRKIPEKDRSTYHQK